MWSSCPKNRLDLDANTNCHRSLFTGLHSQNSTEQETTHQDKLQRTFTYNQALTHPHARSVLMLPCCQPAKWINPAGLLRRCSSSGALHWEAGPAALGAGELPLHQLDQGKVCGAKGKEQS